MAKSLFRPSRRHSSPEITKRKFLEGIKVKDTKGSTVIISELWEYKTVILKVLRRFGCPLCRYESRLLSELKPEFDELDIGLVGVGFENIGLEEFLSGGYWDWEILIDEERVIHNMLNLKKVSVTTCIKDVMSIATRAALNAAKKAGIKGNDIGDGLQLGGTFVIEKYTSRILYEHRQIGAGSYCSIKEIFKACGGDPEDVEEKAPESCIAFKKLCTSSGECFADSKVPPQKNIIKDLACEPYFSSNNKIVGCAANLDAPIIANLKG